MFLLLPGAPGFGSHGLSLGKRLRQQAVTQISQLIVFSVSNNTLGQESNFI